VFSSLKCLVQSNRQNLITSHYGASNVTSTKTVCSVGCNILVVTVGLTDTLCMIKKSVVYSVDVASNVTSTKTVCSVDCNILVVTVGLTDTLCMIKNQLFIVSINMD
jgi:hypothetical protein